MAAADEMDINILREEMKNFAIEQQQCFYELLPDCMTYKPDEHKYLRQNIGYAIWGPPSNDNDDATNADTTESSNCYSKETQNENADITDRIGYKEEAEETINKIYDQIYNYIIEVNSEQPIYFSTIYNVIFCPEMYMQEKKKEEQNQAGKETEPEKKDATKQIPLVISIPIFKIWKIKENKKDTAKEKEETKLIEAETDYETWYIDTNNRIYKGWTDYVTNNKLPKCTMVLPKDGCYQADPDYPITEDYSTVWLEIIDSPACSGTAEFCNKIDVMSGVVGVGMVGLGIASLFTPVGPIVAATGLAATGITGGWTIGRCSQQLIDRSKHEESINPLDKDALPQWLGLAGSVFGLGTVGGTVAISAVTARGMTVNTIARVAFNSMQGGNLVLNGIGIVYQGYYMIDKYRTDQTFSYFDALNLVTHVMFFAGSVVKIQFAGDIIKNTQGRIIDDYRSTLRNRRLRKQYNRFRRQAAANNTNTMFENAEVIRYIRNRNDLLSSGTINASSANSSVMSSGTSSNSQITDGTSRIWSFENGQLKVKGIFLLDPVSYVGHLIKLGILFESKQSNPFISRDTNDFNIKHLSEVLYDLLTKFYTSPNCPRSQNLPTVPDFEPLLKEMSAMNINGDFLIKLFTIAIKLMQRSRDTEDFLLRAFSFVWYYCKANLRQWGIRSCYRMQSISACEILQKIIIGLFEAIDMILDNLYVAFNQYITAILRHQI